MKVLLLPADRSGCGLYRMILPGRLARDSGRAKVTLQDSFDGIVHPKSGDVVGVPQMDYDVVVFQRPFFRRIAESIPFVQAQGIACVVELDDDVRRIDPRNQAHQMVQAKHNSESNWEHVVDACRLADWVTVSTPELISYAAPHGRVSVIPNAVPLSMTVYERPPREPDAKVVVGWAGALTTHPGDLEETMGQVARAVQDNGARFHVVGDSTGVKDALRLSEEPTSTGWLPLREYPQALTALDVGVVPLTSQAFNRAKSWLKGLEMAALGIPFVASPLPEYERLADEYGIGQIARRAGDWARLLKPLICDEAYRTHVGNVYRGMVASFLTVDSTVDTWVDAWSSAADHRRSVMTERVAVNG